MQNINRINVLLNNQELPINLNPQILRDAIYLLGNPDDINMDQSVVLNMYDRAMNGFIYLRNLDVNYPELTRIARYVVNRTAMILDEAPAPALLFQNAVPFGEFQGKRNSPKSKKSCSAVHRTWVKKSSKRKGYCRKSNNKSIKKSK